MYIEYFANVNFNSYVTKNKTKTNNKQKQQQDQTKSKQNNLSLLNQSYNKFVFF